MRFIAVLRDASLCRHAWSALLIAERADELDEAARKAALRAFLLSGISHSIFLLLEFYSSPLLLWLGDSTIRGF